MLQKIRIHAVPNAPKSACVGEYMDALKIKLAAPPVDGKANGELLKFLSKALSLPKSKISILSGATSREKIVEIQADFDCRKKLLSEAGL